MGVPNNEESDQEVVTVLDEKGNVEQYVLPHHSTTLAAGPSKRHTNKAEGLAVPQMLEIQQGILNETRNVRGSLDRLGNQLEVMNSTFSSCMDAMTTMLEVISNSLEEIAAKKN